MPNPWQNGEYLDKIASHVQVKGGSLPRKKDLPRMVHDIVVLVEEIEKLIGRERSELPNEIKILLANRDVLRTLVGDIDRELGRATGRPVSTSLHIEEILLETKAIVNSLESIQREVRSEGHEWMPLTQLGPHIRQILDNHHHKTNSSREILKRISRRIDPTSSEPSNFEDLLSKVVLLVNNQASKRDDIREKRTPDSKQMDSKDGSEAKGKMKWCTDRINELEENMKNAAKESNDLLTKAVKEANQLRTIVNEKQIKIDKMKATEIDLRHSHFWLKDSLDEAKQHLQTTVEAKQVEIQKLNALHDAELEEQREHAETLQAELAEEVLQHAHSWAEAQRRTKEHEAQLIALERQHAQNLAEQRKLHSSALERAEVDKIEQLDVLRKVHNRQITESEKTGKLKFEQVVRDHEAEEIEWKEALRLEEARSIKKVEEEAQKHKLVIEMLETELRVEKARTTEKVEEEAQKHKNTIEKLEMRSQKLQGILLKQDDYSGLTDLEIVRGVTSKTGKVSIVGFTNMVSKVTTFSEWEWREDREIWSKETMTALVGTKQRRLRKLILGDAIWTTLFQLIFCSPFRILGKEGEHLEAYWNKSFPSDDDETSNEYSWPTPTVISEKYRWETCEAALDSLTKQSSPYGPLRSSFVNHQPQFQERFLETIEAYVDLTEKREQDLLEFLTEAARMWIVFCTQRYRIRMVLPGSNESEPEKKSRLAQEQNDLKFTVAPRLQRHGNAKGAQLEEVSVISGCDGKVAAAHES